MAKEDKIKGSSQSGRAGMIVDVERCIGCHACSTACKTENSVPLGGFRTRVRYLERPDSITLDFVPMFCMQCEDAPCLDACPTNALYRHDDGRVLVDQDACCGNKACISACPYGAIYIDPGTGKADKCDLCPQRTELGMEPACVDACPVEALRFGDLSDPNDAATQYGVRRGAKPYRADAGTQPVLQYVGHKPWMESKARTVQIMPDDEDITYDQGTHT